MSTIPFIEARFFNPAEGRIELETRLMRHLRKLRCKRIPPDLPAPPDEADAPGEISDADLMGIIRFSDDDEARIKRRVRRILELRKAASGLEHLKSDDRARLEVLKDGARLISIPSEHHADEFAAMLHAEMPWMAPATEIVWHAMRRSVREGLPGLKIPPLLLDGPPGIGKSELARRLGELLATPTTVIEATGENASFGVVGSQRGWGGSHPGRLIETVLQSRIANPVMVVDEVEKAGRAVSTKGQAFGLAEGLLPLLEPLTAKRWSCPYYQVKFDMSWVIWVLTSNDFQLLPEPLLSRCPPIRLRHLTLPELQAFVRREGAKRALSETSVETICEILSHPTLQRDRLSLRVAARMLERAADLEQGPTLH
ncbi:ATP-dependent Lon protease (plasmid) [Ketogulonicigenium vulgare Y25]|uniref:AAA ATPase, central domain protein n=1 Tax=Ketogulonicigenium vulgare (strain WSH-001) TaxID=759362 RepID=F9YBK3_KETVW|nr:AAA family ATPase [Ketogulonicigenium vulgare]ADO44321.1 ATP-dependent Lon protease [Ketogulonicigenium vulgare Y25]AEM42755.1 AAA ATPase, central domain protein [Ketogulonicigenium vulgare WSH-001]ALJ82800.1 AAA family ATPase [Ketogulonicigenium vulgare]